jgi:asparagine synthase (glutamine-hydrolysing)
MYSSLEVRAPFLSSNVANYALSLPHSALLRGTTGKRILRFVAESYLPATIIARRKHGFALPVSTLLKGDLRDTVETVLMDSENPIYEHLHRSRVKEYWDQHTSGKRDYGKKIWALFMLAAFSRNVFQTL